MAAQDFGVVVTTKTEKSLLGGHPPITLPGTLSNADTDDWVAEEGTVLGMTTEGYYVGIDPDSTYGEQSASAILLSTITVPAEETMKTIVLVHGEVNKADLVWTHDGISAGEKTAAYADLKKVGIYAK